MQDEADPSIFNLLLRLSEHISLRRRLQLCVLLVLMILVSLSEVVSIGAVIPFLGVLTSPDWIFAHTLAQPFIQTLGITEPKELLKPLTIFFIAAAVVSGALRLLLYWSQTRLGNAIGADFSISIYRRTLYQPYAVHLSRNSSEVISSVITKADGIVGQCLLPIFSIISSGMMLFTILLTLIALQPVIAVAAFASFGGIYALAIISTRSRLAIESKLIGREQTLIIKALQEALGGIRDVLIDGTQNVYCRIFESADRRLRRAQTNVSLFAFSPRYIVEALSMVLIAALAYILAGRPQGLVAAIPMIGALVYGAQRLLPVLQSAFSSWSIMRAGQVPFRDALAFLEQPLPDHANAPSPKPLPFQSDIYLDRVGFRYTVQQPWVFRELSLSISKGSRIGFIGVTGSGKSTLLDMIMGLLTPSEGALKLDGQEITPENCRAWQMHIAHVPQTIFLTDASIAENIAFGVSPSQIDRERLRSAAQRAQLADTIESWTDKYDTVVGERGIRLSGGQRQRIGIARALYKEVDVLVLDEATSALDGETEHAVMESIKGLGIDLTVLIVAHRLSTLRDCTHVVELANGVIKRAGTYLEIVGTGNSG